jgi:hypothetical protein
MSLAWKWLWINKKKSQKCGSQISERWSRKLKNGKDFRFKK